MPFDVEIIFEGSRLTPWFYRPDGQVLERLEWLTDVLQSFDAGEQRIRLRGTPRRFFELGITVEGQERRTAENALHDWGARAWALPVWMDSLRLGADLAAGATAIAIDTTTRDYRVEGLVGLMIDPLHFEVAQIDAVTDSSITLAAPLANDWPAHETVIFPVRAARMPDEQRLRRFTGDAAYGRFRFECTEVNDWPAASEVAGLYRTFPVLGQAPNWTEDVDQGYLRKLARFDPQVGSFYVDEAGSGPILLQSHRWLLDGRAEIDAFRRWLYARKGRLSAFWLPTFAQDFVVVASIGPTALTIDVEHCGYTLLIDEDVNRRDIRIELNDGTVFYRRITASVEVSAAVERLSIDADLDQLVEPAQIRSVSYMALVRLEADAAEIAWRRWDAAEASLMTRGARNDL
jgi:hypothetical protein